MASTDKASPRANKQALTALLAIGSLLFCLGMPVVLLHSLANDHRALFEFVGRKWSPVFQAIWRLRSVPRVSHISPVPGAEGKYEVGVAYRWQLRDFEGLNLPDSSDPYYESLDEHKRWMIRTLAFCRAVKSRRRLPLIDGVYMIEASYHGLDEGCYVEHRIGKNEEGVTDVQYQMSVPLIAVIDEEVYPFSKYWDAGAIIWGVHRQLKYHVVADDLIFVAGVTEEVAKAVEQAVNVLVESGQPSPPPARYGDPRSELRSRFEKELREFRDRAMKEE